MAVYFVRSSRFKMSAEINPCVSCGACCAYFRVSFYWSEAKDGGGTVPSAMTEQVTPFISCMSGTNGKSSRCIALQGEVGQSVSCSIYNDRPPPCHEFEQSGEAGIHNPYCDRARAHYGLPPLAVDNIEVIRLEEISRWPMTGSHSAP
ncbi:YkgJ family cysteine cluster protein [Yersinia enterocolitica]|nr:YkgJ family cysteine cluster protein [Yersinia enterocolitica]EKN5108847.1 YkgJ family cysteine cluster protein [Yersinia enterocolitica]EKN6148693.1 YkgJ family cysteine cluster protein [Yersinia enterocolitica]EKN6271569.1 YkgJ family cysteine cluster protein [Yersinia enterocolitica]EKN6365793.1 YkgJ family cysteine cluster protein [Yersinia enterocolitica]